MTSVLEKPVVKALYSRRRSWWQRWWNQSWLRWLTDWLLKGVAERLFTALGTTNF